MIHTEAYDWPTLLISKTDNQDPAMYSTIMESEFWTEVAFFLDLAC